MTGDQWFDFWMRWMQIGGSGVLTFIGGYLGYKIARRDDVGDRWMDQVLAWNKRALTAIDKLYEGRRAGRSPEEVSRELLIEHSKAIGEDPPAGRSRVVPSPAQIIVLEVGNALARYPGDPERELTRLKVLTTEYNRWSLMGHGPRWLFRLARIGNLYREDLKGTLRNRGLAPAYLDDKPSQS